jgi:hypothetical protein
VGRRRPRWRHVGRCVCARCLHAVLIIGLVTCRPLQGILSKGAVSFKQSAKQALTAARASPGSWQAGLSATLSSALLLTHTWCCPVSPMLPLNSSWPNAQSPLRLAARTCEESGGSARRAGHTGHVCSGARLAAGVVLAVPPVQVGCAAVVEGVHQLVHQHVLKLGGALHVVVTHYHLRGQGCERQGESARGPGASDAPRRLAGSRQPLAAGTSPR